MNQYITASLTAASALVMNTCSPPPEAPAAPVRPAQVITIPEGYSHNFTAEAGDTLNIIMTPDPAWVDRCRDMGGEGIFNPHTLIATCERVDF